MSEIRVKRLTEADLKFVRKLRNLFRHNFFDSRPISSHRDQLSWFYRDVRYNKAKDFYMIYVGEERAGTVCLNYRDDGTIGIDNLAIMRIYQGRGIATAVVNLFTAPGETYQARVLEHNQSSIYLFRKLGFQEQIFVDATFNPPIQYILFTLET